MEDIEGAKIQALRLMEPAELLDHGWTNTCPVIVLSTGTILYPSSDEEGNEAGALVSRYVGRGSILLSRGDRFVVDASGLVGKTIRAMRRMTEQEQQYEDWSKPCIVLELENKTVVYPSCDEERNEPGVWFSVTADGATLAYSVTTLHA